jgi:hypothetical protein
MRGGIVVAGIIVLAIGLVLVFVPLAPQGSSKVNSSSTQPFEVLSVSGFSLTGSIPVSVSWSSEAIVLVAGASCSSSCETGSIQSLGGVAIQTGTSGSFTLNQPDGGEIVLEAIPVSGNSSSGATTTFNVTTAMTTVGSAVAIVGIVIVLVGIVLRSKRKAPAPTAPMPPAGETNPPAPPPP